MGFFPTSSCFNNFKEKININIRKKNSQVAIKLFDFFYLVLSILSFFIQVLWFYLIQLSIIFLIKVSNTFLFFTLLCSTVYIELNKNKVIPIIIRVYTYIYMYVCVRAAHFLIKFIYLYTQFVQKKLILLLLL